MRFSNRRLLVLHFALIVVLSAGVFGTVPVQAEPFAYRVAPDGALSGDCGTDWSNPCALQYVLPLLTSGGELWVKEGIHKPGSDRNSTFRLMNGVAIYGGFSGNETSREQRDPSVHITILSGDLNGNDNINIAHDEPTRADNVLHVFAGSGVDSSAILDGFTIAGGNANLNYGTHSARGGGIWIGSGNPTITNVIFTGNSSLELGGGMYNENNSSPTLTNVTFTNNSSEGGGGLTNYRSSPTLTNVNFTNNAATFSGGGVLNLSQSSPIFVDVTIADNSAFTFGGGMSNYNSTPRISNSTFYNNHASGNPHPFHIYDNTAPFGGGLYNAFESNPILENTTITGNTTGNVNAGFGGSGIGNQESSLTLINVTITGNSDGIMNDSSHIVIRNSIIWRNPPQITGEVFTIYDDPNSSSTVSDSVIQNGFPSGTNIITTDPFLGNLGDYGGNTQTIPLSLGSSAINQGNPLYCPPTDQRGIARPQGSQCDIGAYEAGGTFVPTPTNTPTIMPTVTSTPVTSCDQITAGSIIISGNSMSLSIINPLTVPVQIQDVFVVWNHDKGHMVGNDKTLNLTSVSLNGTIWSGNGSGPSITIIPSSASYIPIGTSTIMFNFHQSYENIDGTEELLISLATNGCQAYPIHSTSIATNTPTYTPTHTLTSTPTPSLTPTNTFTPTVTPPYSYNPLYLSLTGNQSIGGVASADEDILRFDGTIWSLFFDGSDVGVGSSDLFGFSIVDSDTILMAFSSAVTVNGLTVNPQDVVRFEATSLGSVTAGTFHMYLDGSDVGFDTTAEKIDSVSLLPDGRVLISTTGNPAVAGVTGGRDEDVLAFSPISLGDITNGSWAMYFDGSDVGLAETSGEDVDALDVVNGKVYLSTTDNFVVNGVAGADEDVFVCESISLGDVTACNYLPALYFDGSTWGLTANDVDAFNFLVLGPLPTNTPINTPTNTATPTPTFTATVTNTAGPTLTPTNTPTVTATAAPTNTGTPTSTPNVSELLFKDGFESANFSVWSANTNDLGDLSVSASAALVGAQGMLAVIDDANTIYITDDTPNAEPRYRARFYFDPNSITMVNNDAHFIFKGFMGTATDVLQVEFRSSAGAYQIRGKILNDNSAFVVTSWFTVSDASHVIEVDWRASTGAGANNGGLTLWIDGVQQADLAGVDNDTSRIDRVRLGALAGMDLGTSGTYFFDAFESRRQTYIGP